MTHYNTTIELIEQLNRGPVDFNTTMQTIENEYIFHPCEFKNGQIINTENTNNGSCKIFAFGQLNGLSPQATLNAFGRFYTEDVLKHPDHKDHLNIRNFMEFGWEGIHFENTALTLK
ncbi:HopJ type III effector protein [Thiomicrorhabdus arctica]|jgi:hypothetical protein|uniref:HopJ type III effector protein n=1 Tax=Thiomicrorhabdus arctica TaxID=131540 RepID=UPI00036B2CC4|nr:HopJ type III effector protein [Thiomicrorhabdus arctica]